MGKKNKKKDITGVVYSTKQNYDYSHDKLVALYREPSWKTQERQAIFQS